MTNFLSSPNHNNIIKGATVSLVGALALSPLAGCSSPSLRTTPGDIVCSGMQVVPVEKGDTFDGANGIVATHIDTKGTIDPENDPSEFRKAVDGLTFHLGEVSAGRAKAGDTFVISGRYDVNPKHVTAGEDLVLPQHCVEVEKNKQ